MKLKRKNPHNAVNASVVDASVYVRWWVSIFSPVNKHAFFFPPKAAQKPDSSQSTSENNVQAFLREEEELLK